MMSSLHAHIPLRARQLTFHLFASFAVDSRIVDQDVDSAFEDLLNILCKRIDGLLLCDVQKFPVTSKSVQMLESLEWQMRGNNLATCRKVQLQRSPALYSWLRTCIPILRCQSFANSSLAAT